MVELCLHSFICLHDVVLNKYGDKFAFIIFYFWLIKVKEYLQDYKEVLQYIIQKKIWSLIFGLLYIMHTDSKFWISALRSSLGVSVRFPPALVQIYSSPCSQKNLPLSWNVTFSHPCKETCKLLVFCHLTSKEMLKEKASHFKCFSSINIVYVFMFNWAQNWYFLNRTYEYHICLSSTSWRIITILWHVNSLPSNAHNSRKTGLCNPFLGNGSINTPRYAHVIIGRML
jgi:hypothetical protein